MLEGTRIIEVEGLGPGPFAAMTLADMGADVICIHRKGGGVTPGMPERSVLDRGKRSIELDLKDPEDIKTFMALVESADGLIEGFRPGVMEKLGIGPEACHAVNPALVFGRMTGWGQDSALSHTAGHDLNYISLSGALWYGSNPGDAPLTPATLVGDIGGGAMYLVAGMLAGILRARTSGEGCVVDAAIYDGSAHMMNLLMSIRQAGNFGDTRGQNLLDGPHWSRTYACADGGFMSVQCLEPKFYAQFLSLLDLAEDADFQRQFDKSLWPALTGRLAGIFASQPRDHWAGIFEGTDACVAPVLSPGEALTHPMNARRTWVEAHGALQAAPAPRFSDAGDWTPPESPVRGQHAKEILAELGRDKD
ncbi:CaiB/BaiF CoA transferase family protein [Phaeobacter gallaeciensis]|uniref:CaiB/BaiF CoA transferase family protein n=1 Tax=Phaeobacter gallaeciensis TaxID=60890 RepID=UPI00237F8FA8|nr:CaiB/BaiF CoA-transferase family protein [Phaeobacter gallaeciensis]MDE4191429.1 CaiB/BaiF CoA-transferase family protein [Phaeobacter gallaeciensis]MDE4199892.1 CaiB/BaiF CoA-transferase family protein [Phaeobacter gallaeciensis]MDE4204042.1 CaiB/BaiF CoA-transferase family protein [Phaeobacter gallaeciensis]MDE4208184.1 CaiB/BaiF CoA-transferase family protein [Phaeobacter gallaeciensis]MDE4216567.1 CaiB/BaiF CoA-transferase family protein [Phaeobacter gallaeciensis]